LLLLNTVLAQDAFVLYDLKKRAAVLADPEQALQQQVAAEAAPHLLASRARKLGMVPAENPVFLRLSDGRILGVPRPATAPPKPAATRPGPPSTARAGTATRPTARPTARPAAPAARTPTRRAVTGPNQATTARRPGAAAPKPQSGSDAADRWRDGSRNSGPAAGGTAAGGTAAPGTPERRPGDGRE
jgi:hypothetical protein